MYNFSIVLVHLKVKYIQNFTWTSDAERNKLQSELDGYKNQKKSIESDMDKLKVSLYAKFGDQIHLERE